MAVPALRGFINPACIRFQKKPAVPQRIFLSGSFLAIVEVTTTVIVTMSTHSAAGIVWGLIIAAAAEILSLFAVFALGRIRFSAPPGFRNSGPGQMGYRIWPI